jgi:hypothetical protein
MNLDLQHSNFVLRSASVGSGESQAYKCVVFKNKWYHHEGNWSSAKGDIVGRQHWGNSAWWAKMRHIHGSKLNVLTSETWTNMDGRELLEGDDVEFVPRGVGSTVEMDPISQVLHAALQPCPLKVCEPGLSDTLQDAVNFGISNTIEFVD